MIDTNERTDNLGAMEFFILALIDRASLKSLYSFQKHAGLQPGGIRPALQRLQQRNLIQRAESSRRQRRDFSITLEGKAFLNRAWQECLNDNADTESSLRSICVALLMGQPNEARVFTMSVCSNRIGVAREKELEAEGLNRAQNDPLSLYMWMRALTEARRRSAEAEAFEQLILHLERQVNNGTTTRRSGHAEAGSDQEG
jgi:DNA-binding PadR family transcriptional regulator